MNNLETIKIGHRGYSKNFKDNSIQSFKACINNNFDMIELDIQLCKNDSIVVYHDIYLNHNKICELDVNFLKKKDIITLNDFFDSINSNEIKIYLDLKGDTKLSYVLNNFFNLHKNNKNINLKNIYIASFNLNHLDILNEFNTSYNLGIITCNNFTKDILSLLFIKYNNLKFIQDHNIDVYVFTQKNEYDETYIKSFNVNGIITNY